MLQGGGALGSYQAGVYQALHEAGIEPDWIIGTSIGAINASLIAGNADRRPAGAAAGILEADGLPAAVLELAGPCCRITTGLLVDAAPAAFPASSSPIRWRVPGARMFRWAPDAAGYYSTEPLEQTLLRTRRFSLVNRCKPRLTVGAAHVRTSQMRYFDSRDGEARREAHHGSGALPPAFPAVRIDGELYWDGGILSNTPTEAVFDDNPRKNSLIFAVHMWNPIGPEPGTIWEVLNRQKDIQYSSRIASHIARQQQAASAAARHQRARRAAAGRRAQQRGGAGTGRLWLSDADARRAPVGAAAR